MDVEIQTAAEAVKANALPRVHEVHGDPTAKNVCDQKMPKSMQGTLVD
jgi:hypothetical protein